MKFVTIILTFALVIQLYLCQQRSGMYKMRGDYLDVPVRASYKIMGNDEDGFLEDGIIVKTKGSGYIDQRYKNRDIQRPSASDIVYGRPVWIRN